MRIFHYNDEERQLHAYLAERGHSNVVMSAAEDPFPVVRQESFDAAFVGLHPHGMQLMRDLRQRNPNCYVTIITSDRDTRRAVEAMKAGAFDYLLSPLDFTEVERISILIGRGEKRRQEHKQLADQLAAARGITDFIGESEAVRILRTLIAKAAVSTAPALITGETGTGKELIARLLHNQSPRRDRPYISINCNAIPTTLLESELFGYRKGAFTGATTDRLGLIAQADGGSFLFDEVSDLDYTLQGKILRVLQEGEIMPLGGQTARQLQVRFIAATNRDLEPLVRQRQFREDLFYRLNVIPIAVPPLRNRREDIAMLAKHFMEAYCLREGREPMKISPAVWRWMSAYPWPGNVRELENVCQRAVVLSDGDTFDVDTLALSDTFSQSPAAIGAAVSGQGLRHSREIAERRLLEQALIDHHGNVSQASKSLGISRTTFYAKAYRYGLTTAGKQFGPPPAGNG